MISIKRLTIPSEIHSELPFPRILTFDPIMPRPLFSTPDAFGT